MIETLAPFTLLSFLVTFEILGILAQLACARSQFVSARVQISVWVERSHDDVSTKCANFVLSFGVESCTRHVIGHIVGTFEGTVDPAGAGGVTIDNFDVNHDTIVLAQSDAADVTLITDGTGTRVTATDIEFTIKGITANQLMAFDGASGVEFRSYLGPIWTNDEVANSADVHIIGTTADEYIGYSSTSTPDFLSNLGQGSGNTATFDMSAGGTNRLSAGSSVAASGGKFIYTGGADRDILSFGPDAAKEGQMSIDLGDDSSIDEITFVGLVGAHTLDAALNSVSIANFKADDTITLQAFTHNQITFTPYADNTLVTAPSGLAFTVSGLSPNQVDAISDNGSAQIRVSGAGSSAGTSAFFSL